jgi:hypothetical protein
VLESIMEDSSAVLEDAVEENSTGLGVTAEDSSMVLEGAAIEDSTMLERVG